VLPGVGAFEECVRNSAPFHDTLIEAARDTPVLGICVGLQILYEESEEAPPTARRSTGWGYCPVASSGSRASG